MEAKDRIIVALDVSTPDEAIRLVEDLQPHVGCFKIGLQFITAMLGSIIVPSFEGGQGAIYNLRRIRYLFECLKSDILWDGKFDDIPNTIGGASGEVSKIGVKMFNLHASAGAEAIAKAVENKGDALVLGVTVLTSIDEDECASIFGGKPADKVVYFAEMLNRLGADGVICSAKELEPISNALIAENFLKVTPGIRPKWAQAGDQKRVMTPCEAIKAGADFLVIGRPIRKPPKEIGTPVDAAKKIAEEIETALAEKGG